MKKLIIKKDDVLEEAMYRGKEIDEIIIEEGVTEIPAFCFQGCLAKKVSFPSTLEKLSYKSFCKNSFEFIDLSNTKIKTIPSECFSNCKIEKMLLPNNLKTIYSLAFYNNNLSEVDLPNSLSKIEVMSFLENNIKNLYLKDNVTYIGSDIVDDCCNIFYKGRKYDSTFIKKYGTEGIINYSSILSLDVIDERILNSFPKEALLVLKIAAEDIKGYVINRKYYEQIICGINTNLKGALKERYFESIFTACYVLGLFNKPSSDVFVAIKEMINDLTEEDFMQRWSIYNIGTNRQNKVFIPKFKELFMKIYASNKDDLYVSDFDITKIIYNNFDELKRQTIKNKNTMLLSKQKELKKLNENNPKYNIIEKEIRELKNSIKKIDINDVRMFFEGLSTEIKEGNERLKEIMPALSLNINMKDFYKIQDMYELSRGVRKNIPITIDKNKEGFKYRWILSDDPINFILGIIMGCCARLGGGGEDIMRQSLINPNITNLVIYDENDKIVGKATSYFNPDEKYILFNNVETKQIGSKGLKSASERKEKLLEAILRACIDVIKAFKDKGISIKEIGVGMNANDLKDELEKSFKIKSDNLLKQYYWDGYRGDAASEQAVLYKDDIAIKTK